MVKASVRKAVDSTSESSNGMEGRNVPKFTMVEILVVISVILLLVGILMPALMSSREKGHQTACLSNLKQLSLANNQYSSDHGYFCPARHPEGGRDGYPSFWYGEQIDSTSTPDYSKGYLAKYIGKKQKILNCPSWQDGTDRARGYGYNNYGVGSIAYLAGYDSTNLTHYSRGMQPEDFQMASRTIMFSDCAKYSGGEVIGDCNIFPPFSISGTTLEERKTKKPTTKQLDSRMHARHNGFVNIAWVDGHASAEELTFSFKRNGSGYDENYAANNIGHVGPEDNSWWDPWNDTIPESP